MSVCHFCEQKNPLGRRDNMLDNICSYTYTYYSILCVTTLQKITKNKMKFKFPNSSYISKGADRLESTIFEIID